MKRKILWVLVGCLMALFLVLTSCGPAVTEPVKTEPVKTEPVKTEPVKTEPVKTEPVKTAEEEKGPRGEVWYAPYVANFQMTSPLDPHTCISAEGTTINTLLFDGLLTKDGEGHEVPALAKSWEIAPDWSKIDITLDEKAKWHNGDPVTAEDVKFSIVRAMCEDLMFQYGYEMRDNIDRVEVSDNYHVRIYVNKPYPAFFDRAYNYLMVIPKDYIEKVGDKEFAAHPVGAGPFKIIDFERDVFVNCEAVVDHYRKPPYVKTFHYVSCGEPSTRLAMLKTGEVDFIMLDPVHIPQVQKDPNLRIIWSKHTACTTMVFFDLAFPDEPSPFLDSRVRKAASLAIDRAGICKSILNGAGEPAGSYLAPYNPGYEYIEPDPYDPEKAKELLAEAGYPDGFDTTFTCAEADKTGMEPVAAQLNEVGIRAKLVVLEGGVRVKKFLTGNLHGLGHAPGPWWAARAHPAVALESQTIGGWAPVGRTFPEFREAINKVIWATTDETIGEAAKEFNQILLDSGYRTPLWAGSGCYAVNQRIERYEPVPGLPYPIRMEYLKLRAE